MSRRRTPPPSQRRTGGFTAATMPADAREMLRAIRDRLDDDCAYIGSDAEAARLASIGVDEARRLLQGLATAGLIRLKRAKGV